MLSEPCAADVAALYIYIYNECVIVNACDDVVALDAALRVVPSI